jgi:hypothetical protein
MYLSAVEKGSETLKAIKKSYSDQVATAIESTKHMLAASENANLPQAFKTKAQERGIVLKFMRVENLKKKEDKEKDEDEEFKIKMFPSATYKLGWLRSKKVISRIDEKVGVESYRNISIKLTAMETGDWTISVMHEEARNLSMLFDFTITLRELESMKGAGKTAKKGFNNDFIILNCFNLLQLLARIASGGI